MGNFDVLALVIKSENVSRSTGIHEKWKQKYGFRVCRLALLFSLFQRFNRLFVAIGDHLIFVAVRNVWIIGKAGAILAQIAAMDTDYVMI